MKSFISREKNFAIAVTLLHLTWFLISVFIGNMHTGDSAEYEQQAINIRDHGSLYAWYWNQPIDNDYHSWRPPLYGLYIYGCKTIIVSNYFFLFIQNLFSIGTCLLLLYQCLQLKLTFNPRIWLLAGFAMYPSMFMIANSISADTLFLFIIMLALTNLQKYLNSEQTKYFVFYNLLLILALYTKPALLYFWIPNLFFCVYLFMRQRKIIFLLLPLFFPVMVAFWCARNQYVTGYWHFSSVSHINLVYYNANYPLMKKFGNAYADSVSKAIIAEAHTKDTYAAQSKFIEQQSIAIIKQYPWEYLYWHLKGSLLLFLEPGRSDWIHYFNTPPPDEGSFSIAMDQQGIKGVWSYAQKFSIPMLLLLGVLACWNIGLLAVSVWGLWLGRKDIYIQFLILFFLYITAITGVVGCARYRLTIYPIMLLGMVLWRNKKKA